MVSAIVIGLQIPDPDLLARLPFVLRPRGVEKNGSIIRSELEPADSVQLSLDSRFVATILGEAPKEGITFENDNFASVRNRPDI